MLPGFLVLGCSGTEAPLRRGINAFYISFLAVDDGLEAIPFGGNPFCASGVEDEEMEAVVGCLNPY